MIVIAGHYRVDASTRDEVVAAFRDMVARCRAADGCLEVAITADSVDADRINNLEIWRDAAALDAWRARSDPPDTGAEMVDVAVARYDAVDGGPLFP